MTRRKKVKKLGKPDNFDTSGLADALPSTADTDSKTNNLPSRDQLRSANAQYALRRASTSKHPEAGEEEDSEPGGVSLNTPESQQQKLSVKARREQKWKDTRLLDNAQIKNCLDALAPEKKQQKSRESTYRSRKKSKSSQQMLPILPFEQNPWVTPANYTRTASQQPWQQPASNTRALPFQPAYPYSTFTPAFQAPAAQHPTHANLKPSPHNVQGKQQHLPLTHSPAYNTMTSPPPQPLTQPQPLLLVLDLNGTLLSRSGSNFKTVTPRPNLHTFLKYCFANHRVMVWTSAKPENMEHMLSCILTDPSWRAHLVAAWGRDTFGLSAVQYNQKTQVVKDLDQVWCQAGIQRAHPWKGAGWSWGVGNTVLVDDSVKKAVRQPWNAVRIPEFEGWRVQEEGKRGEDVLGRIVEYLEGLRRWDNVAAYIRREPFAAGVQRGKGLSGVR